MRAATMKERPFFLLMRQTDVQSIYHMQMPRWLFPDPRYAGMSLDAAPLEEAPQDMGAPGDGPPLEAEGPGEAQFMPSDDHDPLREDGTEVAAVDLSVSPPDAAPESWPPMALSSFAPVGEPSMDGQGQHTVCVVKGYDAASR